MGGIFSVFKKDDLAEFNYNEWKEARPDPNDLELYNQVGDLLAKTEEMLKALENYKPAAEYIRKAMSNNAREDDELEAFEAVTKNAEIIYHFYKFSKELEGVIPRLLSTLALACEANLQPLLTHQAIAKRLAEVLDFVLTFDQLKMLRPGLQNDFSFYRRSLGKHAQDPDLLVKDDDASFISLFFAAHIPMMMAASKSALDPDLLVKDDDASFISLFLAAHIPMMTTMSKAASIAFQEDETITTGVATFVNACLTLLQRRKLPVEDAASNELCLRSMVGAIVLYDHVEPEGAFHSRSPIRMKSVCKMLHNQFQQNFPGVLREPATDLQNLKGAIRFSTLHFNDDSTPGSYSNLLA